jgi:hypothetical protein
MLLLAVDDGRGGRLFLNPFADHSRYGYFFRGNRSQGLEIRPGSTAFVDIGPFPERASTARNVFSLRLDAGGSAEGTFKSALDGYFDYRTRRYLKDLRGEALLMNLEQMLNGFHPSASIEHFDLSDMENLAAPAEAALAFTCEDFGIRQGPIMSVEIPRFPFRFADLPGRPRLSERNYPLRIPAEGRWTYTLKISLPEGYEALHLPRGLSHVTAYGTYDLTCELDETSHELTYTQHVAFRYGDVPPENYTAFKDKLASLNLLKNRLLLLEKRSP